MSDQHLWLYLCFFQTMVEKLKSQLEAAQKAKETHAARVKKHETAQSNKVSMPLFNQ